MDGPETADGTLVIMVCRAKHLPNRRKLDKQSPYVLLRIGTTAQKTPIHFRAGQTPEWTHEIRFQLSRDRKPLLKLDVLDETKGDPTPIGCTEIDCLMVFLDNANLQDNGKFILDNWYDLKCNHRSAGTIYLEMTFYPSAPMLPPKVGYVEEKFLPQVPEKPDFTSLAPLPAQSTADEVFVSEDYKKKTNIFRLSDPGSPPKHQEDIFVSGSPKKSSRFAKFKNKLRSKDPISSLWVDKPGNQPTLTEHYDLTPTLSPVDNLELLQADIGGGSPRHSSPPPPPPHSAYDPYPRSSSRSPTHLQSPVHTRGHHSRSPQPVRSSREHLSPTNSDRNTSPRRTHRKPPPDIKQGFSKLSLSESTTVPFSADTIGLDDDDAMPTKVFHLGQAVQSLTHTAKHDTHVQLNPNDIDPRYYAPSPSEQMAKSWRLQSGAAKLRDIKVDLNTDTTGYLGEGKWKLDRFSPSVFQRINDENSGVENKPAVPPKIPQGLSEVEYYVLEKDNYLKDINGRRI